MVLLTALLQNLAAFLHRVASVPLMVDGLENDYSSTSSCGSRGSDFKEDNITKNDNITKEGDFKEEKTLQGQHHENSPRRSSGGDDGGGNDGVDNCGLSWRALDCCKRRRRRR